MWDLGTCLPVGRQGTWYLVHGTSYKFVLSPKNATLIPMKKIGFYSALILPTLLFFGMQWGGPFQWMIHIFVFLLVPLMDYLIQKDTANVPAAEVSESMKSHFYKLITFVWVYVQLAVLIWGFLYGKYAGIVFDFLACLCYRYGFSYRRDWHYCST